MVSTNPPDLPLFFEDRPSGMPTSASTRQAVGSAKRLWNAMRYQRAETESTRVALCQSAPVSITSAGSDSSDLFSVEGRSRGISVCWKVEIW